MVAQRPGRCPRLHAAPFSPGAKASRRQAQGQRSLHNKPLPGRAPSRPALPCPALPCPALPCPALPSPPHRAHLSPPLFPLPGPAQRPHVLPHLLATRVDQEGEQGATRPPPLWGEGPTPPTHPPRLRLRRRRPLAPEPRMSLLRTAPRRSSTRRPRNLRSAALGRPQGRPGLVRSPTGRAPPAFPGPRAGPPPLSPALPPWPLPSPRPRPRGSPRHCGGYQDAGPAQPIAPACRRALRSQPMKGQINHLKHPMDRAPQSEGGILIGRAEAAADQ